MLAQMQAMKIQEDNAEESSRFSTTYTTSTTENSTGEGKGAWHRTPRSSNLLMETLEAPTRPESQLLVKRPRLEENSTTNMAGPAGQASHST
ncbi:hypothetical protein A2U01_0037484 [Trifolium medium]|uniref:Uncharacterized protein n=1 Tax=Trifolium medium TaxID=97028 RepID=A0A392PXI1_9FABA|nr:hypothetical protein [Trifolium medium]